MKIAFKNFLTMLRRYKAASLLNIAGLTLAFTAFYVIMVQVCWELGYNRSLPAAERIYLVEVEDWYEPGQWSAWINRPVPERTIASTPGVEVGGCLWGGFSGGNTCWTRNDATFGYNKFTAGSGSVSLPVLDVFAFRSVEGNVHDLAKPNSVLVSRRAADRMGIGVGDLLWVDTDEPKPDEGLEVVAIFEDFPGNTLLGECEVVKDLGDLNLDNSSEWNYNYFVRLHPGADPAAFGRRWAEVRRELQREQASDGKQSDGEEQKEEDAPGVRLSPLSSLYFASDSQGFGWQGSVATTYTLVGIAMLVIVLAFINFVNFFFALVPIRIRTVNTFKIFGAPTSSLRFSFVFEALGLVVLSLLAAWYLCFALQGSEFANYINVPLALSQNGFVVLMVAVVAFVMALAASLYPACYITSFAPAMVVKGSFSGTRGGRRLRVILLSVQFFISLGLIIATGFIHLQHTYMMHYDMGFDKRNLIAVWNTEAAARNYEVLRSKLLSNPKVCDVTGASSRLVSENRMGWGREFKGRQIGVQTYVVQWNFLQMMGLRTTDGRDFLESDMHKEQGALIFNESARREFDMVVGDLFEGFASNESIVGFCVDFNFKPLQYDIKPFAFYIVPEEFVKKGWHAPMTLYLRTIPGTDFREVAEHIRHCITEVDPRAEPGEIQIRGFEEELGEQYASEHRLTVIVGAFSLLAVVIALMGVFGIVLFETQHRRREIAVRKVMGATTGEILRMFNARYIRIVTACFVIAIPVCIWAVDRWLSTFAYRVAMSWWVFALSFVAVLAVTVLTVTTCVWRTARENPANSVKSE